MQNYSMDSRQFLGYCVAGADTSYSSSYSCIPSIPSQLFGSLKSASRSSPNSPLSNRFDFESLTTLVDSQDVQSSTENLSGASPSCNSSLDYSSYFNRNSSLVCYQDSFQIFSANLSGHNLGNALQELETKLMAPDVEGEGLNTWNTALEGNVRPHASGRRPSDWSQEKHGSYAIQSQPSYVVNYRKSNDAVHVEKRRKAMQESSLQGIPPSDNLKQLLIACARALAEKKLDEFEALIERARGKVSISGEPIQRLGAYVVEGLVARKEASGSNIYRALRCRKPEGKDLLSYMHILYEICPYLKFGYMAANGAIAEACRNEDRIHIIDFQIAQGTQWMTLLQALAARPSGAPRVRITGIDDPVSRYARGGGLEIVGRRLAAVSQKFNIPVEFHAVPVFGPDVTREMLDVKPGEAVAVNFPLQLHHTPDESVDVNNPRDGLLRMARSLNPKVTTLVEQESNTNTASFFPRFLETLDFYSAMFESVDVTLPRNRKERISVEQHCLARDIVNIIACEGKERVERHELFGKWKSRLTMAGFRQFPLSSYVNSVMRSLLRSYSDHYTLKERDGAMLLGWKDRNLVSASAWH